MLLALALAWGVVLCYLRWSSWDSVRAHNHLHTAVLALEGRGYVPPRGSRIAGES
jgi:hypothetical protein